jgi:hypothetical protein
VESDGLLVEREREREREVVSHVQSERGDLGLGPFSDSQLAQLVAHQHPHLLVRVKQTKQLTK